MSHLVQFPPHPHPNNERKPPYVHFKLKDEDVTSHLPPRIPLRLILSYIPSLRTYLVPSPPATNKNRASRPSAIRHSCAPHVTINIPWHVEPKAFAWIIKAALHTAALPLHPSHIPLNPDFSALVLIHVTWTSLSLPLSGLHNLDTSLYTYLSTDGVFLQRREMAYVWSAYPHSSRVVHAMASSFFRGVIALRYRQKEVSAIVYWWLETAELHRYYEKMKRTFEPQYTRGSDEIWTRSMEAKRTKTGAKGKKEKRNGAEDVKEKKDDEEIFPAPPAPAAPTAPPAPAAPTAPPAPPAPPTPVPPLPPLFRSRTPARQPPLRTVDSNESFSSVDTAIYSPESSIGWYDTPEDIARKQRAARAQARSARSRERAGNGKEKAKAEGGGKAGANEVLDMGAKIQAALEKLVRERDGEGQ
jgi:hypothetical protein